MNKPVHERHSAPYGVTSARKRERKNERKKNKMVFVLDQRKKPLMPCTPKRAVVHRVSPFVIRLKDRLVEESRLQPVILKIDPGSKTTGMALARSEPREEGEVHHAVHLSEVRHQGEAVHERMQDRARSRRSRRSVNLRYRQPRFDNRTREAGWLPPSLRSRISNVLSWARRYGGFAPLERIDVERVKFDMQLLQNPEIAGVEYQGGERFGWEVRAYLVEKFQYRCAYCGKGGTPFELDHMLPKSRGGSERISNLALACHDCNHAKGKQTAAEFGHPEVEAQAKAPLKDAAAVNATRSALVNKGDALLKLEAMKMEHTIRIAAGGVVEAIYFAPGETVAADTLLVQLKEVD